MLILNNEEEKVNIIPKLHKPDRFLNLKIKCKEILTEKLIDINSPISINSNHLCF